MRLQGRIAGGDLLSSQRSISSTSDQLSAELPDQADTTSEAKIIRSPRSTGKKRRWLAAAVLITVAVVLAWLGFIARDALLLRADVLALQDYATALPRPLRPQQIDLSVIQPRVDSLHANLSSLRNHAAPLLALAPLVGWVPNVGGDIQNAPALLDLALQLTDMSRQGVNMLAPFWPPPMIDGRITLPGLVRMLQALQPAVSSFRAQLDRANEIRADITTAHLSPRLNSIITQFDEIYPMARTGLELAEVAPQLLGADRPYTYLILIQNEDELRATGGFLGAFGRVTIDHGEIISMTVEDAYAVDDFSTPYPDAPAPLRDYMGIDLWVFRDSNWSPDFPTAARQAMQLYQQARPGTIDGVIGINQRVVEALVEGAGPITIDGQTLTGAADLQAYMRQAWSPSDQSNAAEWIVQRKSFINRAVQALLDRVVRGQASVDWQKLGRAVTQVLRSRDLLLYFTDAQAGLAMNLAQLDGALRTSEGDYLLVVDSNVGFNKVSTAVQQALAYTVTLDVDRAPQATLTMVYTNTNPPDGPCVHHPPNYDLNITYDQMVQQCYWTYRRLLTPPGSMLTEASPHPTGPGELVTKRPNEGGTRVTTEDGKTVFGTFLVVPRDQRVESFLSYTLPISVVQHNSDQLRYHLVWQKQPGAGAWPATVTVQWPPGLRLMEAYPQPAVVDDQAVMFEFALDRDQEVEVTLSDR
jgi:hypothetical protein